MDMESGDSATNLALAANSKFMAKFKSNLTCPLCYETYNEDEKLPKCLPCQHNLCAPCLQDYIQKNIHKDVHVCPLCKEEFYIPKDGAKRISTNSGLKFIENIFIM